MALERDVQRIAARTFSALDTPRSLTASLLLKYGEWDQLVRLEFDPLLIAKTFSVPPSIGFVVIVLLPTFFGSVDQSKPRWIWRKKLDGRSSYAKLSVKRKIFFYVTGSP